MPKAKAKATTARRTTAKRKTAVKKVAPKKTATKKPAAKKAAVKTAVKASPKKIAVISDKQTKTQIYKAIAEHTELKVTDVKAVFESFHGIVEGHLKKRGSGQVTIPEVGVKIRRVRKPATKARKGRNPFTGEEITIKAKPARDVVRVTALKSLKEIAD